MKLEDSRFTTVQTSSGKIRLGSVDAASVLEFLETASEADGIFRLIAKSIVDESGSRLTNISAGTRALRRRDARVIDRLRDAVFSLNDIAANVEEQGVLLQAAKDRLRAEPVRLFAHRLAAERGLVNADEVLRSVSWSQLRELQAYGEIEFVGEIRTDIRFALLASVVAGAAGATGVNGKPYTADTFLNALRISTEPAKSNKQSEADIEKYLTMWIDGANRIFHERTHGLGTAAA